MFDKAIMVRVDSHSSESYLMTNATGINRENIIKSTIVDKPNTLNKELEVS